MPEKHDMATLTARFGERRTARSARNGHTWQSTTVRKTRRFTYKSGHGENVYGNKPGQSRQLPQSTASRNIGASQRCPRSDATAGKRKANLLNMTAAEMIFNPLHLCLERESTWFELKYRLLPKQIDENVQI